MCSKMYGNSNGLVEMAGLRLDEMKTYQSL